MHRNELAIKGSFIGFASQIISVLSKFAVRTFIIRFLGGEVLGLDGVLIDTISMLSLAEMGISSAMLFRLYEPVITKKEQRINELMATYRQIYHVIACVVVIVGFILSFALKRIITGISIPWRDIYIAFYLQLACTACSYLLSYQRLLLGADQKNHLCILVDLIINTLFSFLKIAVIILFHKYSYYLCVNIVQTASANIILRVYTNRHYPFLNCKTTNPADLPMLFHDTVHLLGNKLAGYVYTSTDNLIVSIFLGTGVVGLLTNYKYISTALAGLVSSTTSSIQPLLGNYLNSDTKKEDSFLTLQRYTFIRFALAGATAIPLITISHDFVRMWAGDDSYVLDFYIPLLLAADYYISCVYGPLGEYILSMGLFKKGKYATFAGAICNLLLSVIGVRIYGIFGVLAATVVSQLVIWIGDYIIILYEYYHDDKRYKKLYLLSQIQYFTVVVIAASISFLVAKRIEIQSPFLHFIVGGITTECIYISLFILLFHGNEEYRYLVGICRMVFKRLLKR